MKVANRQIYSSLYKVILLFASRILRTALANASLFKTISIIAICSSHFWGSASFFISGSSAW